MLSDFVLLVDCDVASFPLFEAKGFDVLKRRGCPLSPGTPKSGWAVL